MANNVKTVMLLGLLTGIILFIGSFWGQNGVTVALVFAVFMNFASYFFSDKIALRMYGAQPVARENASSACWAGRPSGFLPATEPRSRGSGAIPRRRDIAPLAYARGSELIAPLQGYSGPRP